MRVLVTAFNPFGKLDTNSSMMVLDKMKDTIDSIEIEKLIVPTVYTECARIAWEKAMEIGADAILCLGQAGGRSSITVEVIGINYALAKLADNNGCLIQGDKLCDGGEAAIFSTVPVKEMVSAVKKIGFDAELSISAGGFVCNSMLYTLLKKAKDNELNIPIGFVHLPYEKNQGMEGFSMNAFDMCLCVEEMIKVI